MLAGCGRSTLPSDAEVIQEVFQTYRNSILRGNGSEAASCLDARSIRYYNELVKDSLTLSRRELDALDIMSKLLVVRMRIEITKAELEKMSGLEFFAYSIEKGWTSSSSVSQIDRIVNITSDGRMAQAGIPAAPQQQVFFFMKEDGKWKLAAWKMQALADQVFKKNVNDSGMTVDEYIKTAVSAVSKHEWDDHAFEGPIR